MDHPKKIKLTSLKVHWSKQELSSQRHDLHRKTSASMNTVQKSNPNIVITSKEQILSNYPDIFEGIGKFPGPPYCIQVDPNISPKQTTCRPVPIHLKEAFKKETDKMLQAGIIKPVKEDTYWINRFVLIEGKDKSGYLTLHICLDPTSLNKSNVHELYHFKTPEGTAHLIANSCIMTVCDCKKGYWYQELDEASSFLTTFNTKLGRFWYTVMPFSITVAGDVFQ